MRHYIKSESFEGETLDVYRLVRNGYMSEDGLKESLEIFSKYKEDEKFEKENMLVPYLEAHLQQEVLNQSMSDFDDIYVYKSKINTGQFKDEDRRDFCLMNGFLDAKEAFIENLIENKSFEPYKPFSSFIYEDKL